jgi:hypothetical protein
MREEHVKKQEAESGRQYALLVDVVGEDEVQPEDYWAEETGDANA